MLPEQNRERRLSADGNGKVYSNIGVVLYDYSNGTGNNTVKVYVNVTPEDIYWLYNALTSHTENFELEQTKIFGQPDNNGYSQINPDLHTGHKTAAIMHSKPMKNIKMTFTIFQNARFK